MTVTRTAVLRTAECSPGKFSDRRNSAGKAETGKAQSETSRNRFAEVFGESLGKYREPRR